MHYTGIPEDEFLDADTPHEFETAEAVYARILSLGARLSR